MKSLVNCVRTWACALLPVCVLVALAPLSNAQWSATTFDNNNPVFQDGFIVIHEGKSSGLQAFSAVSRKWITVAFSGSAVLGIGDWTMLAREPSGVHVGYSARRNNFAHLITSDPILTLVHDDVILVVDTGPLGTFAHGYSAVHNAWSTIPLATIPGPGDIAISRFVIAIRDKDTYHGFAARTGGWNSLTLQEPGDSPAADGNTVLVNLTNPIGVGIPQMAAFSGVRGTWAVSPAYDFPPVSQLDHNVASTRVRTAEPGFSSIAAYTAYDAAWVVSPTLHIQGGFTESISDNVVLVSDLDPSIRLEAFGARPANWATLPGDFVVTALDEDYVVANHSSNQLLEGYSGVCGGFWASEPAPSGAPVVPVGAPDHMLSLFEGPTLHSFMPAMNSWAPIVNIPAGSAVTGVDAMTDIRTAGFSGNAGRWGGWSGGPPVPAAPFTVTTGGSVVAHQQVGGFGIGDIYVYDERSGMWPAPFNPGGLTNITAGRNLLISDPGAAVGAPVHGYSVQRGDWESPGALLTPLAIAPVTDENVAWMVDRVGRLWAFGSPNVGNVYYPWPNGTEYHTSGNIPPTTLSPFMGYSILGTSGVTGAYALLSLNQIPPTVFLPFAGFVCLDLSWFVNLGYFGETGPDCLNERLIGVPSPLPACLQVWLQPLGYNLFTGIGTWEHRCDPAWFF